MMMKTMTMAWALGKEVQREVESPSCSSSGEQAPGEGLEVYASRLDTTVVIGCRKDPKTYKEASTSLDHRWIGGRGVDLQSLHIFLMLRWSMS